MFSTDPNSVIMDFTCPLCHNSTTITVRYDDLSSTCDTCHAETTPPMTYEQAIIPHVKAHLHRQLDLVNDIWIVAWWRTEGEPHYHIETLERYLRHSADRLTRNIEPGYELLALAESHDAALVIIERAKRLFYKKYATPDQRRAAFIVHGGTDI